MVLTSDSSSEDDIYVCAASRLKALKKKEPVGKDDSPKSEKRNTDVPDFWRTEPSELPREFTTDVYGQSSFKTIDAAERNEDFPILEKSIDSLNCTATSVGIDDDNYSMDVKVRWRSRGVVRLELRKYESFEKVFKHFAETEGISEKQILILKGNRPIHKTDTPASLDLRVIDILDGGTVKTDVASDEQDDNENDLCKIKVQMSTKQRIVVDLRMNESFKTVVLTCAEKLRVAPSRIKLSFDGDEMGLTDTPESLDLEREACIDLRIVPES